MLIRNNILLFSILLTLLQCCFSEFITMSLLGTAAIASGWYKWNTIKDNTYCRYVECCNDQHVPFDINKLKLSLSQRMFGQPLVDELVNILHAHKEAVSDPNKSNKKALVISLHGWPGVGKNYAATMIAEALYAKGMHSKYVKLYMGKKDFDCSNLQQKKEELVATLNSIVRKCPKSLIIFDEIHDMCPSVLDTIKPMLDHHHAVDGIDYRDSIFIFISNIGGQEIATKLLELYDKGAKRNDVEFHDFEPIIRRTAYFQGGFEKAAAIANHLIDHYVPFLPLEQQHVEMCALAEFRSHAIYHPTKEMMMEALSVITYGPNEDQPIFANNGCKRFTRHIPYVIQKNKQKTEL
ncbi:torsin-like protein [Spodoptera frugiperda]|uniref:Torsin-like protein n=1 Tax=Spodoptera frugiperda TaxID=7108 RepID=A0A9R0CUR1_SPOFR|nr:torsin-like protein [Spodoptera frugiperda]